MINGGSSDWWANITLWLAGWRRRLLMSLARLGNPEWDRSENESKKGKTQWERGRKASATAVKMQVDGGWYHSSVCGRPFTESVHVCVPLPPSCLRHASFHYHSSQSHTFSVQYAPLQVTRKASRMSCQNLIPSSSGP